MVPRQCRVLCTALIVEHNDWVSNYYVLEFGRFGHYYMCEISRSENERVAHIVGIPEIQMHVPFGKRGGIPDPSDSAYRANLVL